VVFARQANITSGPQQVNNGVLSGDAERSAQRRAHAHMEEKQIAPTELLEDTNIGRTHANEHPSNDNDRPN
jgi:hypothetical protein